MSGPSVDIDRDSPPPAGASAGALPAPVRAVRTFMDMVKFSHTVFALPFAAVGLLLPLRGVPPTEILLWVLVAMVGARTAAMSFNRLADHRYDAFNPRTAGRALPAGMLSRRGVLLAVVLSSGLFGYACWKLNHLCFVLAVPTLVVIFGYSLLKRITSLSHFGLGIALGIAPLGGYLAVQGAFDPSFSQALLLGAAVLLWVAGFDIIYACQDLEVDRSLGLHSLPARLGIDWALRISRLLHVLTVVLLLLFGWHAEFGAFYFCTVVIVAVLLVVEHRLVSPDDLDRVNMAFFHVNAAISVLVLAGVAADLLLPDALAGLVREGIVPAGAGPDPFIIVGLMLFVGYLLGEVGARIHVPRITGYLAAGVLLGPAGIGLLLQGGEGASLPDFLRPGEVMAEIALGLIVFTVGLQVDLWALIEHPRPALLAAAESLLAGAAVTGGLVLIGWDLGLAAVLGGVAMSSSPAVVILVRRELGADGPMVRRILATVGLNNLLSFTTVAVLVPFMAAGLGQSPEIHWSRVSFVLLRSLGLGILLGAVHGWLEAAVARDLGIFLLRGGIVLAGLGLAGQLGLSPLMLLLCTGVSAECFARWKRRELIVDFGRVEVAFFIVLFVVSGTHLHFSDLLATGAAGLVLVLGRLAGKAAGVFAAGGAAGLPDGRSRAAVTLCLVPMAGMALGLSGWLRASFPDEPRVTSLVTLVLASVAVFETIGPPLTRWGLLLTGEVPKGAKVDH